MKFHSIHKKEILVTNIVSQKDKNEKQILSTIDKFFKDFKDFKIGSLLKQSNFYKDLRTWGDLFYVCCDELHDIKFTEALQLMINLLKSLFVEKLSLTKQQTDELLEHFIVSLPAFSKDKPAYLQWET